MTDDSPRYQRNPSLILRWEHGTGPTLVNFDSWRSYRASLPLLELLGELDDPLTAQDIAARWAPAPQLEQLNELLNGLADAEILHTITPEAVATRTAPAGWTPYEQVAHRQAASGPQADARAGAPPPPRFTHEPGGATIPLATAQATGSHSLADVLSRRRSIRSYACQPLPLNSLGALFDRAARVQRTFPSRDAYGDLGEVTLRPSPSGGARHSLEIYLIARDIDGLNPGAYHYDPFDHALHYLTGWTDELAATQDDTVTAPAQMSSPPPASLYLASYAARTSWKYKGMALSLIYRDTGCLLQTLHLTATDLGLASCITARLQAPLAAPFLKGHDNEFIHTGNLALGLPPT